MVRMTLTHPVEKPNVLVIEAWEVNRWIEFAQKYRFGIELELIG